MVVQVRRCVICTYERPIVGVTLDRRGDACAGDCAGLCQLTLDRAADESASC